MHIADTGSVVTFSDRTGSVLAARLAALGVAGVFCCYAISRWISYFNEPEQELIGALGVTGGALLSGLLASVFAMAPHITTTVDRATRTVRVEQRRLLSKPHIVTSIRLEEIIEVNLRGPTEDDGFFISIVQRSGPPIAISRFSQSRDAARRVSAEFDDLRRKNR